MVLQCEASRRVGTEHPCPNSFCLGRPNILCRVDAVDLDEADKSFAENAVKEDVVWRASKERVSAARKTLLTFEEEMAIEASTGLSRMPISFTFVCCTASMISLYEFEQ